MEADGYAADHDVLDPRLGEHLTHELLTRATASLWQPGCRYAVLGGTPQYQVWAGRGELSKIVADRILAKGESLYEEPLHLLREEQEIRGPGTYFAIGIDRLFGD